MRTLLICLTTMFLAAGVGAAKDNGNHSTTQQQSVLTQQQSEATATGGDATNAGNNQTTKFSTPHQAPAVLSPESWPTAPCRIGFSGGGSWLTGGIGFGASKLDKECAKEHAAQAFEAVGEHRAALEILCTTKAAKVAHVTVCKRFPVQPEW